VVRKFEEELQLLQLEDFGFDLDFLLVMVWNFYLAFWLLLLGALSLERGVLP
jgi:hypothetical protein